MVQGTVRAGNIQWCRIALLGTGCKPEQFYNAGLLCEETEDDPFFWLNISIHPLSYATLYSLPINTKLIPLIYHKNLDTA
jgi:hypothetical protein